MFRQSWIEVKLHEECGFSINKQNFELTSAVGGKKMVFIN